VVIPGLLLADRAQRELLLEMGIQVLEGQEEILDQELQHLRCVPEVTEAEARMEQTFLFVLAG
jgi:hypothetical protein